MASNALSTERIKLSLGQRFWHYSVVVFFLLIPIAISWFIFQDLVLGVKGIRSVGQLACFGYPWIIPAVGLYYLQRERLKFRRINAVVSPEKFRGAVQTTAQQLGWKWHTPEANTVIAHRGWNWTASWGELITIHRTDKYILINSICDPDVNVSIASWGWNRKNIRTFEKNLMSPPQ